MGRHEVSDGTYTATVAARTEDLVTFIAPTCEPTVLITPDDALPQTALSPGDSVTITIAEGTITGLKNASE